jgi:hypothetical protein
VTIAGPPEARRADGLAIDFVVESDRAQLGEIVQQVRDGRLRTNIGNVATLGDAVAAFKSGRADQRADDHPRSSVSDTLPSMQHFRQRDE